MAKPVLNLDEASGFPMAPEGGSERYGATLVPIGDAIGARKLGCLLHVVEPGRRAFPFHNHLGNEEMFVVLAGTGEVRIGDATHPIRAGDVIACPAGGPETAHQIVNTGSEVLRYLGISTKQDPDVMQYPESDKFAVLAIAPGTGFVDAHLKFVGRTADTLDYWEGET